ncbi:DNA-3-methyladenine glycosylase [Streptomyces abikoensis]
MRLIGDGVVDREGVAGLASRLGYSSRQVHRQLTQELGAGPIALARARRAHTARVLLQTTDMPVTGIAFAAGFASVRQFNDTMREIYAATPSSLRVRKGPRQTGAGIPLRLAHRGPYAAPEMFGFLQRRAVPGVEEVLGAPGSRLYRRTLRLPYGTGVAEVGEPRPGDGRHGAWLDCRLHLTDLRDLATAVQRVRRLFDLDADPYAVAERLGADPLLRPLVTARPGLRSPGAADGDELAVRAVLGQQVSLAAAVRLGAALVAAHGKPLPAPDGGLTHLFPDPATLADAALDGLGMPQARKRALRATATALADGAIRLDPGADRDQAAHALLELPGIGPWTAGCIRMRALGDPDVFLPGDAGARHGLAALGAQPGAADAWRPWRSYALHHLWQAAAAPGTGPGTPAPTRKDP